MNNVGVMSKNPDARPLLICDDVSGLRINGFASGPSVIAEHLVSLDNVRDAVIKGVIPPAGAKTWLHITGEASANILLIPDDLRNVRFAHQRLRLMVETPFILGDDVPPGVVRLRTE